MFGTLGAGGVLLLNDVLTVRAGEAGSHAQLRWQEFTGEVLDAVARQDQPVVVILWGKPAQAHASRFTNPKHLVLKSPHPSPLSAYRGFSVRGPFHRQMSGSCGMARISWIGWVNRSKPTGAVVASEQ